jgi:hypothetical protein
VILLDVIDHSDNTILLTVEDHNGLQGFEGPSGSTDIEVTLPDPLPPSIHFRAHMTVYGLNDWIQAKLESYPTNGTYTYNWVGNGVTQNLYYLGGLVISNNTGNETYCSGMTYETWLLAYEGYLADLGLPPQIGPIASTSQMQAFRRLWYGATGISIEDEYQSTLAIERNNLGFILDDLNDARAGDHIQFWRHSGSGHSPIFQSWGRDGNGNINRLYYWGSQSSTNGLGFRSETVSQSSGIDPARLHVARVMKPRASDDWDLRFGDADSSANPTLSGGTSTTSSGILYR